MWFIFSGILITIGLIFLFTQGLNLGIDFAGGTIMEFQFEEEVTSGDMREVLAEFGLEGESVVQETEEGVILLRTRQLEHDQVVDLQEEVESRYPTADMLRTSVVGPTIGQELQRSAFYAILFAGIAIVIYISFRFQFRFAISALGALAHDVLIVLGVMAILGREINSPFIAALLTIVGYSINDSIVIFDRVREKLRLTRRNDTFAELNNEAVVETLPRSINTSLTTLMPVLAILFLGGATLQTFMIALLVGILCGTYSSVFIVSPLLVQWNDYKEMKTRNL